MRNGWTYNQFKIIRVLMGSYLLVHFVHLIPYAQEVFSNMGALADKSASPLLYLFPKHGQRYWGWKYPRILFVSLISAF